ncbi:ABC transporter ATP-binding protein [Luteipulveratus flavus]|uniref:ATP-binding cassette domain-containing protein n=1 Tax=Luteipulveratus flavus TaxID=3031728 RepID=A0ABT6CA50_9MICO|nr:ATP-binding cassette domain-containing protein [Luteipulveratus sp. YIM 133296]MDF8264924.1 ATP-binding cassette domain-containing protein [Luteipulveratus sp. YIM 133296]
MSSNGVAVETRGLVHIYRADGHDVAALAGVDLAVAPGDTLALLGPSGSGKSTLLTLCGGLLRPSAGRLSVGEHELTTMTERELDVMRARDVGMMLQGASRNLIPYLTPRENVAFAQGAARKAGKEVPVPGEVLEQVGMDEHADAALKDLTPGHLQLTALAVGVAARPGLLLADEPTSQLHHDAKATVLQAISDINATNGTTVVLVTHDPDVAAAMGRTITIRDGRIGAEGRDGEEYAVVTADGSLPLPPHVLDDLPPGTLVRVHHTESGWQLHPFDEGDER